MRLKNTIFFLIQILLLCTVTFAQSLTVRDIMAEPSIAGMRPDTERLSPDGRWVVFSWNAEGKEPRDLYITSVDGGAPRILVKAEDNFDKRTEPPASKLSYGLVVRDDFVKAREKNLFGVEFSPDSKRILFLQNSDIFILDLTRPDSKTKRLTKTQAPENRAFWLDDNRIAFQTGGNFFSLNIIDGTLVQITREANPQAFISIGATAKNKPGTLLAYVVSDGSKQRALVVPNYLDEFTVGPTFRRGWSEQRVYVNPTDGSGESPFEVKLPKAEGNSFIRSIKWAADESSLIVDREDRDTKRRQLFFIHNVGSKAEQIITVTEETDQKWIASLSGIIEPNPNDNSEILFASERDGYNHLYLATLERAKPQPNPTGEARQENPSDPGFTGRVEVKQITRGNWEINFAKWANEFLVLFSSTKNGTAERQFSCIEPHYAGIKVDSADEIKSVTTLAGMKTNPQMENGNLLFGASTWNQPTDLYGLKKHFFTACNANPPQAVKLTDSVPEAFKKYPWSAPKFVDIPSKDGKLIKSKIYLPANYGQNRAKQLHPMVIFVHGAGYLQNTINGWNNYFREFMFHTILTQKGYIVLDIDYRGSAGYGRDWRTDVYDFLGGLDYDDHLDAIYYMIKNYSANPAKVGAYGGSYGGFMAEMLIMRAPEKMAAAAALRPVADWKNYYASSPIYTAERLGFPDKNPEAYKRSSPISYADKLRKPLLILHGMSDDNVHVQDSIQLIEKLIRLGKTPYFETMLYPSENHGFARPESWADEYERIFNFFEKHLKN